MNIFLVFLEGFLTCFLTAGAVAREYTGSWGALLSPGQFIPLLLATGGATLCGIRRVVAYRRIPDAHD